MASPMMGISVLTIVKNRADHLAQLVEGLRLSDVAAEELVIIDMSDRPLSLPTLSFPIRLQRLAAENGLPLAKARNLAAKIARSDTLLFLDVDCIPMATLVGTIADVLRSQDIIVCPEIRYLSAGQTRHGWSEERLLKSSICHPGRQFPTQGLRAETNPGLFWSLAFGIQAKRFEQLGGFDEDFVGYGAEDTDFGFRAKEADVGLFFLGGIGAFHQHHDVYDPPLQHYEDILRNAKLFYDKWREWPMTGWLKAFEKLGLIRFVDEQLVYLRQPLACEIKAAKKADHAAF